MSVAAKDGAWVSATQVTRIDCDKCGVVLTSTFPMNERETVGFINKHLNEKHGGRWLS